VPDRRPPPALPAAPRRLPPAVHLQQFWPAKASNRYDEYAGGDQQDHAAGAGPGSQPACRTAASRPELAARSLPCLVHVRGWGGHDSRVRATSGPATPLLLSLAKGRPRRVLRAFCSVGSWPGRQPEARAAQRCDRARSSASLISRKSIAAAPGRGRPVTSWRSGGTIFIFLVDLDEAARQECLLIGWRRMPCVAGEGPGGFACLGLLQRRCIL